MRQEFRMPDAGEGLAEAEVLAWRVAVGDVVRVNEVLLEIETAKAAVELPSPYAGTVLELLAAPGDVVEVGTPIIAIDVAEPLVETLVEPVETSTFSPSAEEAAARTAEAFDAGASPPGEPSGGGSEPKREAVLVGYGVRAATTPKRRPRLGPHGVATPEPGPPGAAAKPVRHGGLEQARAVEQRLADTAPKAKPPVRRLARDLGVDLSEVAPSGPHGTVTHEDVTNAARLRQAQAVGSSSAGWAGVSPSQAGDQSHDEVERVPLSHVGRMMAQAMTRSAFTAPHVTVWLDVDASRTMRLINRAREHPDWAARTITPLTVASLGLVRAATEFPTVNASLDGDDLVLHRHVNLGVAVDSPRGLVVPHIPSAESLDLAGLAEALAALVATARAGRSRPEQLRGSTISITNVGVFGVDGGTPILNPGESAILALGRVTLRPWIVAGAVVPRHVVTLALSFDHRVIDGALGSRVLRRVADFVEDPGTALALG